MMRRMAHAPVAHPIGGAVPTHWSHVGTTPTLFPGALRHKPRGGDPWRSSTAITVICAVPIPRQRPRSAMLAYDDAFRGHVADRCAAFSRLIASDAAGLKRSAVAITLLETRDGSGIAGFLLTRRAKGLRSHGGQWALPGDAAMRARRSWRRRCGSSMRKSACGSARAMFSAFSTTIQPARAI